MKMHKLILATALLCLSHTALCITHIEVDGIISIEAENFSAQSLADHRRWFVISKNAPQPDHIWDTDVPHTQEASGNTYIEVLPDTRSNRLEKIYSGDQFRHHNGLINHTEKGGAVAVLSYPIVANNPGRYYVWARSYRSGHEDNGVHFGLNGTWPINGLRVQFCLAKYQWGWTSARRFKDNNCGTPLTAWVDIPHAGVNTLMVSMREDGFELDKIILTQDKNFKPEGVGPDETIYNPAPLIQKTQFTSINNYKILLRATEAFAAQDKKTGTGPSSHTLTHYSDKKNNVNGIDSTHAKLRDRYIGSSFKVTAKHQGEYHLTLITQKELSGESRYRIKLNNKIIGEFQNPTTKSNLQEHTFTVLDVAIKTDDIITVESMAITNGTQTKNGSNVYSEGRWMGIALQSRVDQN